MGGHSMYKIKLQNNWNDIELNKELKRRIKILNWMKEKNIRSYEQVGEIVTAYKKQPENLLKKIKEDSN